MNIEFNITNIVVFGVKDKKIFHIQVLSSFF